MLMFLDNVFRYDNTGFAGKVFGRSDVECRQIDENQHAAGVEGEKDAGLLDVRDSGGIETEADGFASSQKATIDALDVDDIL